MPADGLGEGGFFEVASETDEIGDVMAVTDRGDSLVNDRAVIKDSGGVVGGCANEFHAAFVGLVVGLGPGKGGQEAVVNVDHGSATEIEEAA